MNSETDDGTPEEGTSSCVVDRMDMGSDLTSTCSCVTIVPAGPTTPPSFNCNWLRRIDCGGIGEYFGLLGEA